MRKSRNMSASHVVFLIFIFTLVPFEIYYSLYSAVLVTHWEFTSVFRGKAILSEIKLTVEKILSCGFAHISWHYPLTSRRSLNFFVWNSFTLLILEIRLKGSNEQDLLWEISSILFSVDKQTRRRKERSSEKSTPLTEKQEFCKGEESRNKLLWESPQPSHIILEQKLNLELNFGPKLPQSL